MSRTGRFYLERDADVSGVSGALRRLLAEGTPGEWYVDGPEFGGMWVCVGHGDTQKSGAVHPSTKGQPYAVLAGMGEPDSRCGWSPVAVSRLLLALTVGVALVAWALRTYRPTAIEVVRPITWHDDGDSCTGRDCLNPAHFSWDA